MPSCRCPTRRAARPCSPRRRACWRRPSRCRPTSRRAYLDVIPQSQSSDEFWFTCVPDDVADELFSCPGTSFREAEITIDGQPAGVAPVYPWLFTGAIDPLLWRPIPSVQTLNFVPYRVDLTPFAGVLSNGQPHQVGVSVFNANNYFLGGGSLLLYLDHGASQVTGAVTRNTLGAVPAPHDPREPRDGGGRHGQRHGEDEGGAAASRSPGTSTPRTAGCRPRSGRRELLEPAAVPDLGDGLRPEDPAGDGDLLGGGHHGPPSPWRTPTGISPIR